MPILTGLTLKALDKEVAPSGQMIDVGGYRLHINCIGPENNLPTVIIESGSGMASPLYHWIQQGVSETTRVCVYDRAGLGWSEESGLPRDAKTVNDALHTLLHKANIKKPFVFAGHSIAGLYNRDYIERFPGEVIGLVLLDPSHPDQGKAMKLDNKKLYPGLKKQVSTLQNMINLGLVELYDPTAQGRDYELTREYPPEIQEQLEFLRHRTEAYDAWLAEFRDFETAARQAAKNKALGDMPLVIISAGKEQSAEDWPEEIDSKEITRILMELHGELLALTSNGARATIKSADHMSLILNKEYAAQTVPYIRNVVLQAADNMQP